MKNFTRILSLFLLLMLVVQVFSVSAFAIGPIDASLEILEAGQQPSKYSSQYNSGQRDVVATTLNGTSADSYYSGAYEFDVLSQKSASEIKSSLASLMQSTHSYKSSYDDCHYKANRTDCENEDGRVSLIYTSYSATMSQWNGWNREHVWPKSKGGNTTSGGGADLHHIRPSDASVNSSRGNKPYGDVNGGTAKYGSNPASGVLGGHYSNTYFEPLDNVKGDVARICLYVYVRWGGNWGATNINSVFQSIDVLLAWCELDPVDTWELGRNEVIQDIQGNRNVFIDYPEYAWLIFGREVPEGMTTPSGSAKQSHVWDNGTVTKAPTCTATGIKTFTCSDCGETKTEVINSTGHSWDNGNTTTDAGCESTGVKTYTCANCGSTKTSSISATGHKWGEGVITQNPTCTESGIKTFTCSNDASHIKTETMEALGHSWSDWVVDTEPTEEVGGNKHKTCSSCGEVENATIPPLNHEHNYEAVVTAPTCTAEGYTTHTCACGKSYKDTYVDIVPHNFENKVCTVCGAPDPSYDNEAQAEFAAAVDSIANLEGKNKYAQICVALDIYRTLSKKDRIEVADKYDLLKDEIQKYNMEIESLNSDMDMTSKKVVGIVISVSALSLAALGLFGKKIF